MNLSEIKLSLPRGLHNAILRGIDIRYESKEVELRLEVLGNDGGENSRTGLRILVEGLLYVVIEPPHPNYFDDALEDGIGEPW